jgi:hypothetical protein
MDGKFQRIAYRCLVTHKNDSPFPHLTGSEIWSGICSLGCPYNGPVSLNPAKAMGISCSSDVSFVQFTWNVRIIGMMCLLVRLSFRKFYL